MGVWYYIPLIVHRWSNFGENYQIIRRGLWSPNYVSNIVKLSQTKLSLIFYFSITATHKPASNPATCESSFSAQATKQKFGVQWIGLLGLLATINQASVKKLQRERYYHLTIMMVCVYSTQYTICSEISIYNYHYCNTNWAQLLPLYTNITTTSVNTVTVHCNVHHWLQFFTTMYN